MKFHNKKVCQRACVCKCVQMCACVCATWLVCPSTTLMADRSNDFRIIQMEDDHLLHSPLCVEGKMFLQTTN